MDEDKPARAVELYTLACRHALVVRSAWFEDMAGKRTAELALCMLPETVVAARERGRTWDWGDIVAEVLVESAE